MTWPPSGCGFALIFKQSGSSVQYLHWWSSHCKCILFWFFFKVISWFSSPVRLYLQPFLPTWDQMWEEAARVGNERKPFHTCTNFLQFKLSTLWHSAPYGKQSSGHSASHLWSARESTYTVSSYKITYLSLLNWAKIHYSTNLGMFSCKQISWGDQRFWFNRNTSIFVFSRH